MREFETIARIESMLSDVRSLIASNQILLEELLRKIELDKNSA